MFLFTNRAKTQLARNVGVNDTTLTLMSGGGALFPAPSGSDDLFPLTLASANNPDNYEITYCIARNGDVLTVQRGQEGTTARNFMSGDVASLNATATTYRRLAQAGHLGTFSSEVAATQGGYKRGAIVNDDSVATTYWINLQDGNTTRPGPDNPTWQELDGANLVHDADISGLVSGTIGMVSGDARGLGLHTRGSDNAVLYNDGVNGWRPLALNADLQAESQRAQAAESQLVLGTKGLDDYSLRITGVKSQYSDTAKKNPVGIEYMDDAGLYQLAITRDYADTLYAPQSALQAETQRARTAEAQAVSGTRDMANGDIRGVGLHTRGSDKAVMYGDGDGPYRQLALLSDVQAVGGIAGQAISGVTGLASGDHQGIGLHTQGGSNAVLYNDSANGWRYLVVGEGNNTDGDVRGVVFSAGASGDRSSPTFIDGNGRYIGLLPSQSPVVNGTLKTDTIASVGGAAVSVSYDGGGRVAFQNDGNLVGYSSSGGVNFALGSSSCTLNGPLMINNNGGSLGLNPNTTFNGQMRGQISWGGRSWYPGGDGLIMVDNGNILAEAISPTLTYRFTMQVVHGSRLVWPRQFADDNVQIAGMVKDNGNNNFHIVNFFNIDRYGAVVSLNVWNGSGFINETASTTATFIVTGSPL